MPREVGFNCPNCGITGGCAVINSRHHRTDRAATVRRLRVCSRCAYRFETIETLFRRRSTKLTMKRVTSIRQLYAKGGISMRELALLHEVSKKTIYDIVHHLRWSVAQ